MACHVFPNVRLGGWGLCSGVSLRGCDSAPLRPRWVRFLGCGWACGAPEPTSRARVVECAPELELTFGGCAGGENSEGPRRDSGALRARPGAQRPEAGPPDPAVSAAAAEPGPGSSQPRQRPALLGEATGAPPSPGLCSSSSQESCSAWRRTGARGLSDLAESAVAVGGGGRKPHRPRKEGRPPWSCTEEWVFMQDPMGVSGRGKHAGTNQF